MDPELSLIIHPILTVEEIISLLRDISQFASLAQINSVYIRHQFTVAQDCRQLISILTQYQPRKLGFQLSFVSFLENIPRLNELYYQQPYSLSLYLISMNHLGDYLPLVEDLEVDCLLLLTDRDKIEFTTLVELFPLVKHLFLIGTDLTSIPQVVTPTLSEHNHTGINQSENHSEKSRLIKQYICWLYDKTITNFLLIEEQDQSSGYSNRKVIKYPSNQSDLLETDQFAALSRQHANSCFNYPYIGVYAE